MSSISESKPIIHGYSVLRVVTDDERGDSVPVGVVAWDARRQWHGLRMLAEDEAISGLSKTSRRFALIGIQQLRKWASRENVPYGKERSQPWTDLFWRDAAAVMTTAVRIDSPKAMDPMQEPEEEFEHLFEAIVQPKQSTAKRTARVDGAISRALGQLSQEIPSRVEVSAFGEARETVLRGAVSPVGVLLIDGVNLSSSRARDEADALVSRFERIRTAYSGRRVQMIVGYCTSPGGLNGEGHMKEWIQTRLTDHVYDLAREKAVFQRVTEDAWRTIERDPQEQLL